MTAGDAELLETLRLAQRLGFFGGGSIESGVAHAQQFVDALADVPPGARVADLGSGGGLPGLVIARRRPDLSVVLVDRRQKRSDFLRRAVERLGAVAEVRGEDVAVLAGEVERGEVPDFDAVTARSFGPPSSTLRVALRLMAPSGRFVVSEPPDVDRWDDGELERLGVERRRLGGVSVFVRQARFT